MHMAKQKNPVEEAAPSMTPSWHFLERQSYRDEKQILGWEVGSDCLGWMPVNMHWSTCIALYSTMGQSKSIQVIYCINLLLLIYCYLLYYCHRMECQIQQNLNITHYSLTIQFSSVQFTHSVVSESFIREMQIKTANEVLPYISHNAHHQ